MKLSARAKLDLMKRLIRRLPVEEAKIWLEKWKTKKQLK